MASVLARIKRNPAVVVAFLAAVVQALEAQDVLTWNTVATIVAGIVIRQFVTPSHEVGLEIDAAFRRGVVTGLYPEPTHPRPIR